MKENVYQKSFGNVRFLRISGKQLQKYYTGVEKIHNLEVILLRICCMLTLEIMNIFLDFFSNVVLQYSSKIGSREPILKKEP